MTEATTRLAELDATHVLAAIALLDRGVASPFAESTKFDLIFEGRRYPPKRVAGHALAVLDGQPYGPKSFKGGDESSCFRALKRCGFTIVRKDDSVLPGLREVLAEILSLQTQYSSSNTPEMQRRGVLIRDTLPGHINRHVPELEPAFSKRGLSLDIKGSDGAGRKNESAWVRIFDPAMSPSATTGWYVVLHFSRLGEAFFATVGCGSTTFKNGDLLNIPESELRQRVGWAKTEAASRGFEASRFDDPIKLHGSKLSTQFELATAFARRYTLTSFDETEFWADIKRLCGLLVDLYDAERLGRSPTSGQPEVLSAEEDIVGAISVQRRGQRGQGRGLTQPERRAVELRAMDVAEQALILAGFDSIRDVSSKESYDFQAMKGGERWFVEVKGTTSPFADVFLLTAPELDLHQGNIGKTVLVLVSGIKLTTEDGTPTATGGQAEVLAPWAHIEWEFVPTAYRARRKISGAAQ